MVVLCDIQVYRATCYGYINVSSPEACYKASAIPPPRTGNDCLLPGCDAEEAEVVRPDDSMLLAKGTRDCAPGRRTTGPHWPAASLTNKATARLHRLVGCLSRASKAVTPRVTGLVDRAVWWSGSRCGRTKVRCLGRAAGCEWRGPWPAQPHSLSHGAQSARQTRGALRDLAPWIISSGARRHDDEGSSSSSSSSAGRGLAALGRCRVGCCFADDQRTRHSPALLSKQHFPHWVPRRCAPTSHVHVAAVVVAAATCASQAGRARPTACNLHKFARSQAVGGNRPKSPAETRDCERGRAWRAAGRGDWCVGAAIHSFIFPNEELVFLQAAMSARRRHERVMDGSTYGHRLQAGRCHRTSWAWTWRTAWWWWLCVAVCGAMQRRDGMI